MAELEIKPTVASRARVVTVIVVAAGITGGLVFLLSGGGPDSFTRKAVITTYMPDVTGLAKNSEVRRNGIRIGKVTKVDITPSLDPQRAVRVDMKITSRFLKSIPLDSQTGIGADTLVGYKFLDIAVGKNPLPLSDSGVLQSKPLKQAEDSAHLIRRFQTELHQADEILIQVSSGETKIGRFVMGEAEYNQVLKQVSVFEKTLRSLAGPKSLIGEALFSNEMYQQFRQPLLRFENTMASIQRGEGAGGRLFASDDQYNRMVNDLRSFRRALADANTGKGRLGPLLQDEAAYRNIRELLVSTDAMLSSLTAGEGGVSKLLRDPQLYESLSGSLRNLQALLQDLRTEPRKYLRYKVY